ncbi:MAG: gliding motility lipoprotein GldD [Bacteroidales bacterium]
MMQKKPIQPAILLAFIISLLLSGCKEETSPRPRGYFRIDMPEKSYQNYETESCPFTFRYPGYTEIEKVPNHENKPCWFNLTTPDLSATIHISYTSIDNNIAELIEDSRTLAYKHAIKAEAIQEKRFINPEAQVYALKYELKGNTASSVQFFITDSTHHFMRGALYFRAEPNKDSLAPLIQFFDADIDTLIESFNWR